jgi:hypothetical protein
MTYFINRRQYGPRQPGFEPRSGHVGFVMDKRALGQVLPVYFCFFCHSFQRMVHTQHLISSGVHTLSQIVADVPGWLNVTSLQEKEEDMLFLVTKCHMLDMK